MQRAAVSIDMFSDIKAHGVFIADIVQFVEEFASFSNPNVTTGYFHWSFLPKGEFATDVIMGYGGGIWVQQIFVYGSGINETAILLFQADNAWNVYANFFNQLSAINASVFDYQAGATTDCDTEVADQKADWKIDMPCHVLYSQYNLETLSGFDVEKVWRRWVHPSAGLTTGPILGCLGHFIVELAPEESTAQIITFLDRLEVAP